MLNLGDKYGRIASKYTPGNVTGLAGCDGKCDGDGANATRRTKIAGSNFDVCQPRRAKNLF